MQPHKQRIVDEIQDISEFLDNLIQRRKKLDHFLFSDPYYRLDQNQKTLMRQQLDAMHELEVSLGDYRAILTARMSSI